MKALTIDAGCEQGIKKLLTHLLESGKVNAVLTLFEMDGEGAINYSLVTNPELIEKAVPLHPLMPANAGKILSEMTTKGPVPKNTAVVIRPCELRAFVEMIKREKGSLENILMISSICPGVFSLKTDISNIENYWTMAGEGKVHKEARPACQGCELFTPPEVADITISISGQADIDKKCTIFLNTARGEEFTSELDGRADMEFPNIQRMVEERGEEKKRIYRENGLEEKGPGWMVDTFGKCIGCKNCRNMCPICYCQLCAFDNQNSEYSPDIWEGELRTKAGIRIPPNTVYFHTGRLIHMSLSCVGCGCCEDVCPVDLPLQSIYKSVGESVAALFNYVPGMNLDEEIPLKTFENEELEHVEN